MFETWLWADEPAVMLSCGHGYGHAFPRHWHDEIHVCAYTAGRGHLRAGGATWRIASGDLVVSPVGEVHENWVSRTDTCSFHSAYLGVDLIDATAKSVVGRSVRVVGWIHNDRDAVVTRALADVHAAAADPDRLFRDECMSRLVSAIVTRCGEGQPDARRLTRERAAVRTVRRILEERFDDAVSLDELAGLVRLSRFHLQRVFTAETGMGPHAYQTQVRINRAKELLRRKLPIADVAARAGFADQSHLHRHFTRRVGITPGQYGRQSR